MTRINLIPPKYLADQHLVAEHKEILQLCGSYKISKRSKKGIDFNQIPKQFTLNKGHVKFFYNKFAYLHNRFLAIQREMIERNIQPKKIMDCNEFKEDGVYNDWGPSNSDINLICRRIQERIEQNPDWYRYKGKRYIDTNYYKALQSRKLNV